LAIITDWINSYCVAMLSGCEKVVDIQIAVRYKMPISLLGCVW